MTQLVVAGEVATIPCSVLGGRGVAARVRAAEIERINALKGVTLVSGSLNLVSLQPTYLNMKNAFFTTEEHFYWEAEIEGVPVILNRWRGCPAHVYEVFSEVHLRSALALADDSNVSLTIPHEYVDTERTRSIGNMLVWYATWRWRESLFYVGERYLSLLRHRYLRRDTRRAFQ